MSIYSACTSNALAFVQHTLYTKHSVVLHCTTFSNTPTMNFTQKTSHSQLTSLQIKSKQ